jgi:hypothetical protein
MTSRTDTFTLQGWDYYPLTLASGARTYEDEKMAFQALQGMLRARHPGEYVAIWRGEAVDHDPSQLRLVQRFFGAGRTGPVYVGFIGPRQVIRIPTPFVRRRP